MPPIPGIQKRRCRGGGRKLRVRLPDFSPQHTVPVRAGGFVRRAARTPHYDGVKKGEKEPAVIGIFGEGPIDLRLSDPSKPPVREV